MDAAGWLDVGSRQRLEAAVAEAEARTGGEIVVGIAAACDEYGSVGWRVGVALAAAVFLGMGWLLPPLPWSAYLAAQAAALGLAHAVTRLDPVRRALLPRDLVEERVAQRARRCFAEQGLARTRGRTGILLFVALLERRVVVLGDAGIDRVLDPDESWSQVVELAAAGLRAGRPAEGLEAAVRRCGEILARHLPAAAQDVDELPNRVVVLTD